MTQHGTLHHFKIMAAALTACCVMGACELIGKQERNTKQAEDKRKNITILHAFVEKASDLKKKDYNPISLMSIWGECRATVDKPTNTLIENHQRHVWTIRQNNKIETLRQQKQTAKVKKELTTIKAERFVPDLHLSQSVKEQMVQRIRDSLQVTGDLNLALAHQLELGAFKLYLEEADKISTAALGNPKLSPDDRTMLQTIIRAKRDSISAPLIKYTKEIDSLVDNAADIIARYKGSNIGMGDNQCGLSDNGVFRQIIFVPGARRTP